ncbi:hypothetical protein AC578_10505 [Pseudocercospora eumusae]|uniref:Uncharacterized protein n=1 Tax=Pseudocercospora eumusae TaxID=321146 RepID=A0A139H8L1_9PEZI|nr:hypothetical protein AC578_10505 [Pseudocercospora eumusae]
MAFRALRQTLPGICGAASTVAGIGWYFTKSTPTDPSALDIPLRQTSIIGSLLEEAVPLVTATPSPLDVCWASSADAYANASVTDSACAFALDSGITLTPPPTFNAILTALATFLLLALLEIAVYCIFVLGQQIELQVSRKVPYWLRSILSTTYQTYYRLAGISEIALLALNFFGVASTSKLPIWLHLLIVAGAILRGLYDFEIDSLPDAIKLQAHNAELRMQIEKLKKRNIRNVSTSAELTHALKAKGETRLAKLEREHQKQMSAIEKQHKKALVRLHISHRLRLSGLKYQLSTARKEATSKLNDAEQVIDGHVTRISELEQVMMTEQKAHTTTITEAQSLIKQSIVEKTEMENTITEAQELIKQSTAEKMEMKNTIAKANGLIKELLQAQSTTQQHLKASQIIVRLLSKHGQTLLQGLNFITVQFQQRSEASERVYFENIFKSRLESKMAMEAVIQQFGHDFARSQGIGHSQVQSTSAEAASQDQDEETIVPKPLTATADFKFVTASLLPTLLKEANEQVPQPPKKPYAPARQTPTSSRRSRLVMTRPMRTSVKSPASHGGASSAAWNLPALDSFAKNGFTPPAYQPTLAPSGTMYELPTGENDGEPSPAATAVDASEIDISAPVAVPQLVAIDNSSKPSGLAVTMSDNTTPLASGGSDPVSLLQDASQSAQPTANLASPGTAADAGSSSVRSPPVPYRETKDEWTENLCKSGEQCVGRWSDYGPKGEYIGKNADAQRWGSGQKPVEAKLAKKAKDMKLCCDCFKQQYPEFIQKSVADFLRKEDAKTDEQKAHDLGVRAHKQARKRERNEAKAAEKKAAAAAAEEDK